MSDGQSDVYKLSNFLSKSDSLYQWSLVSLQKSFLIQLIGFQFSGGYTNNQ